MKKVLQRNVEEMTNYISDTRGPAFKASEEGKRKGWGEGGEKGRFSRVRLMD